ncbi:hypothetical protein GQ457_17G023850 [Hibiscus cannabinus]
MSDPVSGAGTSQSEPPPKDPKKKYEKKEGDLSNEDLDLKQRMEFCVERIQDPNPELQIEALESMRKEILTSTSSLACVRKPLKFLRPHFGTLKDFYETVPKSDFKKDLADVISVLALTMSTEGKRELSRRNYRRVYEPAASLTMQMEHTPSDDLRKLVLVIVAFLLKHNAEPEAVDLLMEAMGLIDSYILGDYVDSTNFRRTCLYLTSAARFLPELDDITALDIAYCIYIQFEEFTIALQIALFLDEHEGKYLKLDDYMWLDSHERILLCDIINNATLSESYLTLARDIEVMEPKSPEDIYKVHLVDDRAIAGARVDSARQNLAATFVNAFVNAGFGQDKLMTLPADSSNWVFKNKGHGKTSAAASLGMILLWDIDIGLAQIDKFIHSNDNYVIAGALLGVGLVNCNVYSHLDPARGILHEYIHNEDSSIRIGAIMGLGIAYAGTQDNQIRKRLTPILYDGKAPLDVIAFTAISLGLICVGSSNEMVAKAIGDALMVRSESELREPLTRLIALGHGLLYLGSQEDGLEATSDVLEMFNEKIRKYCHLTLLSCAYAGTGNILKVQELLSHCAEHINNGETHQGPAVLGIAMVAMAEELGLEMSIRSLQHLLQYSELNIRRAVPLALGLLCMSNPKVNVMDILSRLSHDTDLEVVMAAIISLGLIGAGTNNARIVFMLRNLSSYYYRMPSLLFCVRHFVLVSIVSCAILVAFAIKTKSSLLSQVQIALGLVHLGKGLLTLDPYHCDHFLLSPTALAGLVITLHGCLDMKAIILGKYHFVLYFLVLAMQVRSSITPRMLMTLDENLKPLSVPVRVGQAVDIAGKAGQPKTITGFQTFTTPVLLAAGQRAELATENFFSIIFGFHQTACNSLRAQAAVRAQSTVVIKTAIFDDDTDDFRSFVSKLGEAREWLTTHESLYGGFHKLSFAEAQSNEDLDLKQRMEFCVERIQDPNPELQIEALESMRNLAGEITEEYMNQQREHTPFGDLRKLVLVIVAFLLKHNAEPEAVDLSMEAIGLLDSYILGDYVDSTNFRRACLYLTSAARFLPETDDIVALDIAYLIYIRFEDFVNALQIALFLNDDGHIVSVFTSCDDLLKKKQFCYILARHGKYLKLDDYMCQDSHDRILLCDIINNATLSESYLTLARDVEVMEPKSPEDIYKVHLVDDRAIAGARVDSARQNLAATFVNAFVNAGFGQVWFAKHKSMKACELSCFVSVNNFPLQDKLMTVPADSSNGGSSGNWVFKNKEHGKISAAASLGMILLWDTDIGLAQIDKFIHSNDNYVIAGALLGVGLVNCNVYSHLDPARGILHEYIDNEDSSIRIGAIMGLGIAYAGTQDKQIRKRLTPILNDGEAPLDVIAFTAISLGLIYVGSSNEKVAQAIRDALVVRSELELREPLTRLIALGHGLLYLGSQEKGLEAISDISGMLNEKIRKYCDVTLLSCAYAGTGNILKVQELLSHCAEHLNNGDTHQGPAVLGIAMVAMAEELGLEMSIRSLEHLLQYSELNIRRAVPLALGLLCMSNPKVNVVDILSRLSHDTDLEVVMAAIISLGLIGAGTNNARIVFMLRNLSSYYYRIPSLLFCVQIAQGLVHLGKGLLTLDPYHCNHFLLSPTALAGLVTTLHACLDLKETILGKYHFVLYFLVLAIQPRMLMTLDENLKPLSVPVRVGQAVDIAGKVGQPKTITGFQTFTTPVLLAAGQRAELATEKYIPLTPTLEGHVILIENPEYRGGDN